MKKPAAGAAAGAKPAAAAPGGKKPTSEELVAFLVGEVKKTKKAKMSDMGSLIINKFGTQFKNLGLAEKSLQAFIEKHAAGKLKSDGNTVEAV